MASLVEVKSKIQSTRNTKKITKAMQLVAANKMKTFQKRALASRAYSTKLLETLSVSQHNIQQLAFGEKRTEGPSLFVLVTSDKGLCGALNNRLINELFKSEEWNSKSESERLLITIGKKSTQAAKRLGYPVEKSFEGIYENIQPLEALKLIEKILPFWNEGKCKEIILVSPHYVNPFLIHTTKKTYLPFSQEMIESHLQYHDEVPDVQDVSPVAEENFEPSEERLLEILGQQLVYALFLQAFYELKASEYSSRMVAMKSATEAADEMIHDLTLDYNKARQAKITQELAELAAGTAALE